jgi:hypothetical protein
MGDSAKGNSATSSGSDGCGWDAPTPADSAGGACDLRRSQKKTAKPATVIAPKPPMTPPATAAVFCFVLFSELLPSEGEGVVDVV